MFGIGRKSTPDLTPLVTPDDELTERILKSSIEAGADQYSDYSQFMVGSAAWKLYNLTLEPFDLDENYDDIPRPADVDFTASPAIIERVIKEGTPTDLRAEFPRQTRAQITARIQTGVMPVDLITRHTSDYGSTTAAHKNFVRQAYTRSRPIAGTNLRIASLDTLVDELKLNARVGSDKAKRDYYQAQRFIKEHRR